MKNILQNVTQDLQLASYSQRTVEAYSYHVKKFLEYFNKDPKTITEHEIKDYFVFLNDEITIGFCKCTSYFRHKIYV